VPSAVVVAVASALIVATAPLSSSTSSAADPSPSPSCAGRLDAAAPSPGTAGCPGPDREAPPVAADAVAAAEAPARDPSLFPRELGFVAVVVGIAGGGVLATTATRDVARLGADERAWRDGALVSGASLLGLAGLIGAGAVATAVFDPSTGALRLDLFPGED
jgi:hypothetical protein